jgi:hypothetical protein
MSGNIEQRIFDAFPPPPVSITLGYLRAALPYFDAESLRKALRRLVAAGIVERVKLRRIYRLAADAQRPNDRRGGSRARA